VSVSDAIEPASRGGGPIFIVGAMGSGTTLIRLILDSHPDIAIAQETGFIRAVLANQWIPFWKFGGEWYERIGMTEAELNAEVRQFYDGLFTRFAQRQGKQRWGDKTPYHLWHIPTIAEVFPDAVFVAMVRHPGAVAASLHDRFGYPWGQAVNHWVRSGLETIRRATELGPRVAICRYEDLVLDTEAVLRELVDWLGVEWSPDLLEHHRVQSERGTPGQVEGQTRSDEPIDASRISRKWVSLMEPAGEVLLRRHAAKQARFFGYDVDSADPPAPIVPEGSGRRLLLTGDELVARQEALGIKGWGRWPRPSMKNQQLRPRRAEVIDRTKKNRKRNKAKGTRPAAAGGGKTPSPAATSTIARAVFNRLPEPQRRRIARFVGRAGSRQS
jgi:hypothetical protein